MKKRGIIILSFLMMILFTTNVFAQDVDSASNLLDFNENISVSKEILGDVYSAGRSIKIKTNIGGDVIAAAEDIDIDSNEVDGNIRTASRTLNLNSKNIKNITSVAQTIIIDENTTAKGIYVNAENINFKGSCEGFYASGGTIIINGKVNGDLDVTCDELIIAEDGDITGNIKVKSEKEPIVNSNISVDDINFTKINNEKTQQQYNTVLRMGTVVTLLAALVLGLVLYLILKRFFISSEKVLITQPFIVIFLGIGSFIFIPILSLLLFITVIGLPLGIIMLILYFAIVYLSPVLSGIIVGRFLLKNSNSYIQVLAGVFIVRILSVLPYVGGFVWVVSSMIAFGLIVYELYKLIKYKEIKSID